MSIVVIDSDLVLGRIRLGKSTRKTMDRPKTRHGNDFILQGFLSELKTSTGEAVKTVARHQTVPFVGIKWGCLKVTLSSSTPKTYILDGWSDKP